MGIGRVVPGPIVILVPVGHEIFLPDWDGLPFVLLGNLRQIIGGIAVLVNGALMMFSLAIENFHGFL